MLPMIALCDRMDVLGTSFANHLDTGGPTVFLYDAYPGGVGLSQAAFRGFGDLALAAREAIDSCRCADGCPACIVSPQCGLGNEPLDKRAAAVAAQCLTQQ
jgi:DEAD/DEAH box helicase domain-containing protein